MACCENDENLGKTLILKQPHYSTVVQLCYCYFENNGSQNSYNDLTEKKSHQER